MPLKVYNIKRQVITHLDLITGEGVVMEQKVKQFSELTAPELEKLQEAQKARAEKKNRDLLDDVRCVWTGKANEKKEI